MNREIVVFGTKLRRKLMFSVWSLQQGDAVMVVQQFTKSVICCWSEMDAVKCFGGIWDADAVDRVATKFREWGREVQLDGTGSVLVLCKQGKTGKLKLAARIWTKCNQHFTTIRKLAIYLENKFEAFFVWSNYLSQTSLRGFAYIDFNSVSSMQKVFSNAS